MNRHIGSVAGGIPSVLAVALLPKVNILLAIHRGEGLSRTAALLPLLPLGTALR